MIAYSSIGHMGFVLLGIATLTPVGLNAALFGNVAHGLITGLLFFLAGAVKERYGTTTWTPSAAACSPRRPTSPRSSRSPPSPSLGLPGLAGFWGEMLALLGAYRPHTGLPRDTFLTFMVLGGLGAVLTAAYFLRMLSGSPTARSPNAGATARFARRPLVRAARLDPADHRDAVHRPVAEDAPRPHRRRRTRAPGGPMIQSIDYLAILPALIVAVAAVVVLMADAFDLPQRLTGAAHARRPGRRGRARSCRATAARRSAPGRSCSYVVDDFTALFQAIVLLAAIVVVLLSHARDAPVRAARRGSTTSCCSRRSPVRCCWPPAVT